MRVHPLRAWALAGLVAAALAGAWPSDAGADVTLGEPNGGEVWVIGTRQTIFWSSDATSNVRIEISHDGGETFATIRSNTPNDGDEEWVVEGPVSGDCLVRITELNGGAAFAVSAATFSIVEDIPALTLTVPNGGEVWVVGSEQVITWSDVTSLGDVRIDLSRDGGVFFETVFERTRNDGSQSWRVTDPVAGSCLLRITRLDGSGATDLSDGLFFISSVAGLTVTAPNGGELWTVGSRQLVTWTSFGGGRVALEVSRDAGSTWEVVLGNTPDDGIEPWIVTGPASTEALVRVRRLTVPLISDTSDGLFTVTTDPLTLGAPRGGETWTVGTQRTIGWSGPGLGHVSIELSRNAGATWEMISASTADDGAYAWAITGPPTPDAVVRVTSLDDPTVSDASDGVFTIARGVVTVSLPNGGETLALGRPTNLTWTTTTGGTARIELSRDGGASFAPIVLATPNDGATGWTVTGPPSTHCRLRVVSWQDETVQDESDADFAIACVPVPTALGAGEREAGTLAATDCESVHRPGARADLFAFTMPAPGLVTLDLHSDEFDGFLTLRGTNGTVLAQNDNAGATTDARIDSMELPTGAYTVEVTSATAGLGAYAVTLSRFDVEILSPRGGDVWRFGERRLVSWRSGAPGVAADVTLRRTPGAPAEAIALTTTNDGIEAWTVEGAPSSEALFQVCIPYGTRGVSICSVSGPVTIAPCPVGTTRACYTGGNRTLGVGQCRAGVQMCSAAGIYDACHDEVVPTEETCGDGLDQDCDGTDLACDVCPSTGECDDGDPCSTDGCVAGVCRAERPAAWALVECRTAMLEETLGKLDVPCADAQATRVAKRHRRRLGRVIATVERLTQRARLEPARACHQRLARARQKIERLRALVFLAKARGAFCGADPAALDRRVSELGVGILIVSSCPAAP